MFPGLPEPDIAVLGAAPANLVVFSVGIEAERPVRPSDGVAWQNLLKKRGYDAPLLQKVHEQMWQIGQGVGPAVATSSVTARDGWKVIRGDQSSSATLFTDGCSVERLNYPGFELFLHEIETLLAAMSELVLPSLRTRVSLRYANALSSPKATSPAYWRGKVENSFLGLGADERLQGDFIRTLSIADFREGDISAQVRSGLQPDQVHSGATAFVFDIELSDSALKAFAVDSILSRAKDLNRYARQLFQAILASSYFTELKG